MKKPMLFLTTILTIALFSGCSSDTQEQQQTGTQEAVPQGDTVQGEGNSGDAMQARGNSVTGLVTDVVGNEITIQVGEMQGGSMMGGGQIPEGMELPEGVEGERPEEAGDGMGEMTQEQREEMQGAMQDGEMPEGMGERPEGMELPDDAGGRGEGGGMSGSGMASMEGEDYSEIITLTDESKSFSVPVTTPVVQFGTEMTFSQITEDMYITVMMDDDDNVTSINILG